MGAIVDTEALPARLGRFELRGPLGRGGSGHVVEAWDAARGEAVALKILGHADARRFARFKQEFRALADLSHPNLITLHELFLEEGRIFFSMELLDGVPMLDWVRPDGRLDVPRLRDAMRQLARGTAALHAAGKLHRDIKSSNVVVTREGRVVLLDFGFVLDPAAPSLDRPGHVVGTPAYMSPEQAFGLQVGTASDWYSVGVVLYEALTGQPPFPDRDPKTLLRKRMSREPPPPSSRVDENLPGDLEALCVGLLRRVGSARPDVGAIIATLGDPLPDHLTRPTEPSGPATTLVGRDRELETVFEAAQRVTVDHPVLVFVHGRSGVGKSAFLGRVAAEAEREAGFRVWRGRCYERESMPYKAFDGIIDAIVDDLGRSDLTLTHLCDPAEVHALVRLFPALGRLTGVRGTSFAVPGPATPELRDRAYAALQRVLTRMSESQPIAVFIDDLQWCDADSLRLLGELVRPPTTPRTLFVGAYRDDQMWAEAPLARALLRLRRTESGIDHFDLELSPLDEAASRALANALLAEHDIDRPTLAATLARESEGSPLFLHELVEHVLAHSQLVDASRTDPRPGLSVEQVLRGRVSVLSSDARAVLETIAIAGHRVDQGTVLRAALGDDATATPIDVLRRHRLVTASGFTDVDWIEPVHDQLRRHLLEELGPEARRERHLALANALAGSASSEPEVLATHFARGGADELAALHAMHAASLADEGLAFDLATHWYELALAHLPEDDARRGELQAKLGHALAKAGRGYEGAQALLRAAALADAEQARGMRRLAAHWLVYSGDGAGRDLLVELLREARLPYPRSRARAIASLLALRMRVRLRGLSFRERDASEIPAEVLHRIDLCWALGLVLNADPILAAGFLARHLLLALEAGEPTRIAPALAYEAVGRMVAGRMTADEAYRQVETAAELAAGQGSEEAVAWVAFIRPVVASTAGDWKNGLAQAQHAARALQAHTVGSGLPILTCRHLELWCRFQLGQWAALSPLVHQMIASGGRANPHRESARSLLAFPLTVAADQPERALELLARSRDGSGADPTDRGAPFRFAARTFAHLYQGDSEAAWSWVRGARDELGRSLRFRPAISKSFFLWPCVAAAAARAARGDRRGVRRAHKDVDQLARLPFRPAKGLAELARAGLEAAVGDRGHAITVFESAAAIFDDLDMAVHAAAARHRRGTLLAGDEGEALVEAASATMRAAGVVRPDRLAAALAPGLAPSE